MELLTFILSIFSVFVEIIIMQFIPSDNYYDSFIGVYEIYFVFTLSIVFIFTCICLIIRNKKIRVETYIKKSDDIFYYREPPFTYSPVIVTYIENLKLEIEKDIIAEVLYLNNNGYLHIVKKEKDYYIIKNNDLNNNTDNLLKSQKYIISKIYDDMSLLELIKIMKKNKIKLEKFYEQDCYDMNYIKKIKLFSNKALFENVIIKDIIGVILFLLIFYLMFKEGINWNSYKWNLSNVFLFGLVINMIPNVLISNVLILIFDRILLLRTPKAKEDYVKWMKFKKYLDEYTLIKDYPLEGIKLLDDYLVYSVALGISKIKI